MTLVQRQRRLPVHRGLRVGRRISLDQRQPVARAWVGRTTHVIAGGVEHAMMVILNVYPHP